MNLFARAVSPLLPHAQPETFRERIAHVTPLSPTATKLVTEGISSKTIPDAWLEVSDLRSMRRNVRHLAKGADSFDGVERFLTDEESIEAVQDTSQSFWDSYRDFLWDFRFAIAEWCFDKICHARRCVYRAKAVHSYAAVVLNAEDMAEVMDESAVSLLEGQFLHGS